jgi:hypothetical protein
MVVVVVAVGAMRFLVQTVDRVVLLQWDQAQELLALLLEQLLKPHLLVELVTEMLVELVGTQ